MENKRVLIETFNLVNKAFQKNTFDQMSAEIADLVIERQLIKAKFRIDHVKETSLGGQ